MPKQLLIYEDVVAVSSDKHSDLSIKASDDYGFASKVNSVPLMAVEFARAAMEYPIVFAGEGSDVTPVLILGMHNDENLFVSETGKWSATYVPAFVRRYPFVFSSTDDGKTFTLCIDENYQGCNQEGRGERLFDTDGQQTTYLKGILGFLQEYQAQFQLTQSFGKKLADLGLLESMRAQFTLASGEQVGLAGFMTVSYERLKELSGDQLKELATTGELDLIFRHLHSLGQLDKLGQRVMAEESVDSSATETEEDALAEA